MVDIDYFDKFDNDIPESDESAAETLPNWVSGKNSSLAAYRAIKSLYKKKMSYIAKHRRKSHYVRKWAYQISKSEVARAVGKKKPNALFHSVDYASYLTRELRDKNLALLRAKETAVKTRSSSLRDLSKGELQSKLKSRDRYKALAESKADEIVTRTLERIPPKLKKQLGLI